MPRTGLHAWRFTADWRSLGLVPAFEPTASASTIAQRKAAKNVGGGALAISPARSLCRLRDRSSPVLINRRRPADQEFWATAIGRSRLQCQQRFAMTVESIVMEVRQLGKENRFRQTSRLVGCQKFAGVEERGARFNFLRSMVSYCGHAGGN